MGSYIGSRLSVVPDKHINVAEVLCTLVSPSHQGQIAIL